MGVLGLAFKVEVGLYLRKIQTNGTYQPIYLELPMNLQVQSPSSHSHLCQVGPGSDFGLSQQLSCSLLRYIYYVLSQWSLRVQALKSELNPSIQATHHVL